MILSVRTEQDVVTCFSLPGFSLFFQSNEKYVEGCFGPLREHMVIY